MSPRAINFSAMVLGIACFTLAMASDATAQRSPFPGQGFAIDMLDYKTTVEQPLPVPAPGVRQRIRSALQAGGHAVVCRHGATDWLAPDIDDKAPPELRADRSRQRNLSELGQAEARAIQSSLEPLGLRIGAVYATFYFRTREFAQIATGREPEVREELLGLPYSDIATWFAFVAQSRTRPDTTFISAHGQPIAAMKIPGITLGEGDCMVTRFDEPKLMTVVGRLRPNEWRQLLIP